MLKYKFSFALLFFRSFVVIHMCMYTWNYTSQSSASEWVKNIWLIFELMMLAMVRGSFTVPLLHVKWLDSHRYQHQIELSSFSRSLVHRTHTTAVWKSLKPNLNTHIYTDRHTCPCIWLCEYVGRQFCEIFIWWVLEYYIWKRVSVCVAGRQSLQCTC